MYILLLLQDINSLYTLFKNHYEQKLKQGKTEKLQQARITAMQSYQKLMEDIGAGIEPMPDLHIWHQSSVTQAMTCLLALADDSEEFNTHLDGTEQVTYIRSMTCKIFLPKCKPYCNNYDVSYYYYSHGKTY
jgi:hypothetical protein